MTKIVLWAGIYLIAMSFAVAGGRNTTSNFNGQSGNFHSPQSPSHAGKHHGHWRNNDGAGGYGWISTDDEDEFDDASGYGPPPSSPLAQQVQIALARQGYYRGPINGIVTSSTQDAIGVFQATHALTVTRVMDNTLLNALGVPYY